MPNGPLVLPSAGVLPLPFAVTLPSAVTLTAPVLPLLDSASASIAGPLSPITSPAVCTVIPEPEPDVVARTPPLEPSTCPVVSTVTWPPGVSAPVLVLTATTP